MTNLRPFYFFVVVWGKQFRDYLIHYCIPSLLAPNNIPALINNQRNKLLICTTKEDWQVLISTPIISELQTYIEPIFLEISYPPEDATGCQHMGIGHKIATEMCFKDKAYGIALTPDLLISNGTLAAIQKHAIAGTQIVLCAAIRFAEEPFFKGLQDMGIRNTNSKESSQKPLIASSRQLVQLSLQSFHSETESYDFESHYFGVTRPVALWRLPDRRGLLIHSLSWCPILIDYGSIKQHDTTTLDNWTMDGDYIHKNFKDSNHIYLCQDSDEIMMISWSPLEYESVKIKPGIIRRQLKSLCPIINRYFLHETLRNPLFDPLKLKLFHLPVRWHTNDLNVLWDKLERKIEPVVSQQRQWDDVIFHYGFILTSFFKKTIRYAFITLMLCLGSRSAREKLRRRIKLMKYPS